MEFSLNYYPLRNSVHFLKDLKCWSNFTFIDAAFKTYQQGAIDYSGKKLTGTSPRVMVGGIDAVTKIGIYANLTYSYTDQIPLNDANSVFANAYQLFYGRLGYKKDFGKCIKGEIYLSYDRSFNTPYGLGNDLNATFNRFYNPSAPENLMAGLKIQFNL